jgi:alkanesulfonate monooxygenase SsuD/methylene tetrahydromethanopterin reductase-like flavin-dependent oxidoreductase (luciferase family)
MKVYFFHLMPYSAVDLGEVDKHQSAWVTLPNTCFDPKEGRKLYERYIGELELADELGFDGVCVNEHHQTTYGMMPAPNIIAAALARSTRQAKICILGRALPLVNNPMMIAEEFAMLDHLSNGRIIAGFVRGIGTEYFSNSVNPTFSHERFYEAHDLILKAWTQPGPFAYRGRHYQFDYVNLWPRPVQSPHPEVWVPSQGSTETIVWCAAKERRYTYLQTFSPYPQALKSFRAYVSEALKAGYDPVPSQMGWAVPTYVAETDEQAKRDLAPHVENFFNKFIKFPSLEMRLPPGYSSIASTKALMVAKFQARANATIDKLIEQGIILCGSPKTVRERIAHCQREMGFGHLMAMLQIGTQPADQTERSIRLFAKEVMPYLKDHQDEMRLPQAAE